MSQETSAANGGRTARDRVADTLRERIHNGELRPGESLPTQKALMAEFDVERGTVRQALAQLKRENLLADVTKGSPPTVAEVPVAHGGVPRTAGVELAERIRVAFQAKHVALDAFSLTTETLNQAMAPTLLAIAGGELPPPASITARILVPEAGAQLGIPQLVGDPEDPRPMERLHRLVQLHARSFQHSLQSLVERDLVRDVSLEIKGLPLTPIHKIYVLNGSEALYGFYNVIERTVYLTDEQMDIYDVLGLNSSLFHYSDDPAASPHDRAFFEQARRQFESHWSTIARPLTLGP